MPLTFVAIAILFAFGILVLVYALRVAGVEDGSPLNAPPPETPVDRAWQEAPIQLLQWQVQVARYWQPPFRHR